MLRSCQVPFRWSKKDYIYSTVPVLKIITVDITEIYVGGGGGLMGPTPTG